MNGWNSRPGLWTIEVVDGKHRRLEVTEQQARLVRLLGGTLFDREAFAIDAETLYGDRNTTAGLGPHRILVFPRERPKDTPGGFYESNE